MALAGLVEFHTGVADVVAFGSRLVRKAYRQGARLLVCGPERTLRELDVALWTRAEREFVPHLRLGAPSDRPALRQRTPIWLTDVEVLQPMLVAADAQRPGILLNLGAALEGLPEPFERVIEIVGSEGEVAEAGRRRWRDYRSRGIEIRHHGPDQGATGGNSSDDI